MAVSCYHGSSLCAMVVVMFFTSYCRCDLNGHLSHFTENQFPQGDNKFSFYVLLNVLRSDTLFSTFASASQSSSSVMFFPATLGLMAEAGN